MVAIFPVVNSTSLPQQTHLSCACLIHHWAAANGYFLGGRHTPERTGKPHHMLQLVQRPALCVGLETCLYFTGTECHGCSHTTKECSPQPLAFPPKAMGEDMLQLLPVAQILSPGCAKSVRGCVSLTAALLSTCKGKSSQSILLHHPFYLHPCSSFQLTRAMDWERICNKKLPSPLTLPAHTGKSTHTCFYMCAHTDGHTETHV